jgi:AMP phosphorylase
MEVLAKVTFNVKQIEHIVAKAGGCIVWGGHLGIAPADDIIIQVEEPLAFESFDKVIVSIMAKKIASGATHLILDIPVGPYMKIRRFKDAELVAKKFNMLGKKFNIKMVADVNQTRQPAGRGVGPILECRDVFEILEQTKERPYALEAKAVRLAGRLLDLIFEDTGRKESGEEVAKLMLTSGKALEKMREIIKAQQGDPDVGSASLKPGKYTYEVKSQVKGKAVKIENQQTNTLGRILGSPSDRAAGIYLQTRLDEDVAKGDVLFTMFSSDKYRLEEAKQTLSHMPVYTIE